MLKLVELPEDVIAEIRHHMQKIVAAYKNPNDADTALEALWKNQYSHIDQETMEALYAPIYNASRAEDVRKIQAAKKALEESTYLEQSAKTKSNDSRTALARLEGNIFGQELAQLKSRAQAKEQATAQPPILNAQKLSEKRDPAEAKLPEGKAAKASPPADEPTKKARRSFCPWFC